MKGIARLFVLIQSGILICFVGFSQQPGKTLRVFLIGNSFSQNATRYLPQLAKEGGHSIEFGRAEIGGCPLQRHWDSVEVSLRDSTRGKAYGGKSLKQKLSEGKWDIVSIQQYSLFSSDEDTYQPFAGKLYDFIKQIQPDAEVVIHQTWAYRVDAKKFGLKKGKDTTRSQQEMWKLSRAAYHSVAKQLGIRVIPTGDAFYTVSADKKWRYKQDTAFDYDNPAPTQLPLQENSIHIGYSWTKDNKMNFDANHANEAGCYLGGLVWYSFLFKEDPSKLSFKPDTVSADFSAFLKKVAWKTVKAKK